MDRERFLSEFSIDVAFGPASASLLSAVAFDDVGNLPIEIAAFGVGKKFLVGVLGGSLERDVDVPRPDALQIRLAPRRSQRRLRPNRQPSQGHYCERRNCNRRHHAGHQDQSVRAHDEAAPSYFSAATSVRVSGLHLPMGSVPMAIGPILTRTSFNTFAPSASTIRRT